MQIRSATPADLDAVLELNQTFMTLLSDLTPSRLEELHMQAAEHLVIDVDGEVAAFMLLFRDGADYDSVNYRWFEQRYASFLYVDRIAVSSGLQRRGAGALLYRHVFAVARTAQVPRIACEYYLTPPNPASAAFHARHGFHEVARQRIGDDKLVSLQLADVDVC